MMTKQRPETKVSKRKTAETGSLHVEDEMGTKVEKKKMKVEVSWEYVHMT